MLIGWERSPIVILVALPTIVLRANRILAVATAAAVLYVARSSGFNVLHLLYLLPYLMGPIGGALATTLPRNGRTILIAGVTAALLWGFALTMVLRPVNAEMLASDRNPAAVFALARNTIGHRPVRVISSAWEFYFPGRVFGWRMYANPWFPEPRERYLELSSRADYAIFHRSEVNASLLRALNRVGLRFRIPLPATRAPASSRLARLLRRLGGGEVYGPYAIFSRRPHAG
jgi:hypothetical protein